MDVNFKYRSLRAEKARLGAALSSWATILSILAILLFVAGIALVVFDFAFGWAVAGLTVIPAMIVEWYNGELKKVPINEEGERIDDLLSSDILALLPEQPTPQDIAAALAKTNGGYFFAVRFGIGGNFLTQLVSADRQDTDAVWLSALRLRKKGLPISAGTLIQALIKQIGRNVALLGHLQLDESDLKRGTDWYDRIQTRHEAYKKQSKYPGGIGRDWSFGWIPTLSNFGQNISMSSSLPGFGIHGSVVDRIVETWSGGAKPTIGLIGPTGVGKTEVVYELASTLMRPDAEVPDELRYKQLFILDSSRLVSMGDDLEAIVLDILSEAFRAKNIIVCLDNAHLFFEQNVGSVDIVNLLLPIIEAGRLPLILTMDEQRFLQISKREPALANAIRRVNIQPASDEESLHVMEDHLPVLEHRNGVTYMYQALKESYVLGKRYVYDVAMPGQALRLLEAASGHHENGLVTAKSINMAIEKSIGVKTGMADDEKERETLLNMESLIHERMIGQERAVSVVSDALRRARSGVRNQKRPVGTFLFLGPTGVGKTELAKSLADVYFGGEENIIRLDMNEYVSSYDVGRLIADGADDPYSLTAQVMKKPFSVILLDEIEKADSSVLTTLLQMLDEGVLRDVKNREVNFRDAIVIATSNAGASRIQEYIKRGYDLRQFEDKFVDELISADIFHPEFLNRFDEIIVFTPLSKSELLKVVDLIIAGVNKNLDDRKITVEVEQDAKEFLVEAGYDPRLGARPMRRVVQKAVESTIAKLMLSGEVQPGDVVTITLEQVSGIIDKKRYADRIANHEDVDEND